MEGKLCVLTSKNINDMRIGSDFIHIQLISSDTGRSNSSESRRSESLSRSYVTICFSQCHTNLCRKMHCTPIPLCTQLGEYGEYTHFYISVIIHLEF